MKFAPRFLLLALLSAFISLPAAAQTTPYGNCYFALECYQYSWPGPQPPCEFVLRCDDPSPAFPNLPGAPNCPPACYPNCPLPIWETKNTIPRLDRPSEGSCILATPSRGCEPTRNPGALTTAIGL